MTPEEREPFWGYPEIGVFVAMAPLCLMMGGVVARGLLSGLGFGEPSKALLILPAQLIGYGMLFGGWAVLWRRHYGRPFWRSIGWVRSRLPLALAASSGVGLAFAVAVIGVALGASDDDSPMREVLANRTLLPWLVLMGVTAGPLFEELAFRGLIQPVLVRSLGAAFGVLVPAVVFGALHLPQYGNSWQHGLLITAAGAGFGWMRVVSGSTLASTVMHSAYNLTFFAAFLGKAFSE
ncbi:MAG: CPBP family intramembrane metalloprotease [Bryobacterales bacterium]|nr:CPBP family intramembrane metalloprotease [Bryobacterales bacterium]